MQRIYPDSKSEPDLTTAEANNWRSGYPPGFTVDQLRFHRRRKAPESQAKDHLMPANGTFGALKTEYKRRYLDYYNSDIQDALHFDVKDLSPTHQHKPDDHLHIAAADKDLHAKLLPESHESFIAFPIDSTLHPHRRFKRQYPMMDSNTKYEAQSENKSQFVRYEPSDRALSMRRSTSLNLPTADHHQTTRSETADQFIEYLLTQRRNLIRNPTHLHLDGEMEKATENREQFKVFEVQPRPALYRKLTQLRLDGDLILDPEYRHEYIEHEHTQRSSPNLPRHNLKVDGFFDGTSESLTTTTGHHPPIPFLRGFPEGHSDHLPIEPCPEYRRSFVDFPRHRPKVPRPEVHLSTEGKINHLTEKHAQYVEYPQYQKVEAMKREPELKLEGDFVCQPEYRKAYIDFLTRERIDRKSRPLDNLGSNAECTRRVFNELPTEFPVLPPPTSGSVGKSLIPIATKTTQPRRQVSIGQLETRLFGPKIEAPGRSRSSSRLTSGSQSPVMRSSRTGSRFHRSVHVEDLAYTPSTSPIPTHKIYTYSPRKKWSQPDSQNAFLVLNDLDDVNNNTNGFTNRNPVRSLYKEQKWMNSWNDDSI